MQNGFFDDLLNNMGTEEEIEEVKENDSVTTDGVNATDEETTESVADVMNKNGFSFEQELPSMEESKVETPKTVIEQKVEEVKQEPKKKTPPKKADSLGDKKANEQLVKETPKVENKPNVVANSSVPAKKKDFTQSLIESTLDKINDIVTYSNEVFSTKAKECASDIIVSLSHTLNERGFVWKQIDTQGSGLINQIKRWAKLGIDVTTDKLYPDIRNNSKTGLYDIKVKGQYQTVEKLIIKYCSKKIFRFKTEVICVGDELKKEFDYLLGEDKITGFIKNEKTNRNLLENIIGAFKIAYYTENGQVKQIVTEIDKNRIMRAYDTATTKNVWNRDTQKMVKKTVTWEMWNSEDIRPFMDFPEDIIQDLTVVNESEDVDFNKEHKYSNVVDAQEHVEETIGAGEEINF